jgi:hypothetical protein
MSSHEIEVVEACLKLAETADSDQRRILVELASKWLAKAHHEADWVRLDAEVAAYRRRAC